MQQTGSAAGGSNPSGTQEPTRLSLSSQAAARHKRERGEILASFADELDQIALGLSSGGMSRDQAEYRVTQFVRRLLGIPGEGTWVDRTELRLRFEQTQDPDRSLRDRVTDILLADGIRPHLTGYPMLRDAVMAVADDRGVLRGMMGLYAALGRRYGTTASRAERAMRHALADVEILDRRPSISQYIALLADRLTGGI